MKRNKSRRGGALLSSLVVVILVSGLGAVAIRTHIAQSRQDAASIDSWRAFYAAEAGLSEALLALAQGRSGSVGTETEPAAFGNGVVWVEAEQLDNGRVQLRSTGAVGTGRQSLALLVEPGVNPLTTMGVYAAERLEIGAGSILDGYDSALGSYRDPLADGPPDGSEVRGVVFGSGGDIHIDSATLEGTDTHVLGDVRPGPLGILSIEPGVSIAGSSAPWSREPELPLPESPALPSRGELRLQSDLVLESEQKAYDSLLVETGATLTVRGPAQLVVGDLVVHSGATLELDSEEGPVELYVEGDLELREGSELRSVGSGNRNALVVSTNLSTHEETLAALASEDHETSAGRSGRSRHAGNGQGRGRAGAPVAPSISLGQTPTVELSASGTFRGLVYAPLAPITLPASLRVFGSVVAHELTLEPGCRVTQDQDLASTDLGVASLPGWLGWREVGLPDTTWVRTRLDPVVTLRLKGIQPEKLHASHEEDQLAVEFLDATGSESFYEGPASGFHPGRAVEVLSMIFFDAEKGPAPLRLAPPVKPPSPASGDLGNVVQKARRDLERLSGGF